MTMMIPIKMLLPLDLETFRNAYFKVNICMPPYN